MTEVIDIKIAGSLRRKKEMVKDIDIVIATNEPEIIIEDFLRFPPIAQVLAKGLTKVSVLLNMGIQLDLRVVKPESFYSTLQHFTGSKEHNTKLRSLALKMDYKLNEYGILKKDSEEIYYPKSEEDFYSKLGIPILSQN